MTLTAAAQSAGQALVKLDGRGSPAAIGQCAGLPQRTLTRALVTLRDRGLVDGPKGEVRLTPAGWSHFAAVSQRSEERRVGKECV